MGKALVCELYPCTKNQCDYITCDANLTCYNSYTFEINCRMLGMKICRAYGSAGDHGQVHHHKQMTSQAFDHCYNYMGECKMKGHSIWHVTHGNVGTNQETKHRVVAYVACLCPQIVTELIYLQIRKYGIHNLNQWAKNMILLVTLIFTVLYSNVTWHLFLYISSYSLTFFHKQRE